MATETEQGEQRWTWTPDPARIVDENGILVGPVYAASMYNSALDRYELAAQQLETAKAALRVIADMDMYHDDFVAKYSEELYDKGSDEIARDALRALEQTK